MAVSEQQREAVKSTLKWAFKPGNPLTAVQPVTREMAESGRRIFSQAKSFLSPEKSDARLAEIADAQ